MKRKQAQRRSHVIAFESPYACPPGTSGQAFKRWFMLQVEPPYANEPTMTFLRKLGEGLDDGRVNICGDEGEGLFCVFWDEQKPLAEDDVDQMFVECSLQEPFIVDAASLHAASPASLCEAPGTGKPIRCIVSSPVERSPSERSERPTLHKASGGNGKTVAA